VEPVDQGSILDSRFLDITTATQI